MKPVKKLIAILIILTLTAGYIAFAEDEIPAPGLEAALKKADEFNAWRRSKTAEEIAQENNLSIWDVLSPYGTDTVPEPAVQVTSESTWEEIVYTLLDKYDADEDHVGIGYYNTRTGEEKYISPDKYIVSASMFKVPLNMIIADRVSSGEMSMDTEIWGAPYSYYQNRTIVYSDNERSVDLFNYLGGYSQFKQLQIPYLGNDPAEDIGWNYQVDNFYNAREFIRMLRMLYEEPERFPGILENMLEATPYSYFKQYEKRYPIAEKYGFVEQNEATGYHTYINTCGVVFTEDPFCIVVFTDNVQKAYDLISEYAVAMCDYTNFASAKQDAIDAQHEEALLAQKAAEEATFQATVQQLKNRITGESGSGLPLVTSGTESNTAKGNAREINMSVISTIVIGLIFVAMLIALVVIFRHNNAGKINAFWAVIAILLAGGGLILCVIGLTFGTLFAKPAGNPQDTVTEFFTALLAEDYPRAYSCLSNYSGLGLENSPDSEESHMLWEALKESYDFSLRGDCVQEKLSAKQVVEFRHLNVDAVKRDAAGRIDGILRNIVKTRSRGEVFDEEENYLPSVPEEVYHQAYAKAIDNAGGYITSSQITIPLELVDGKWLIAVSSDLITALSGGAL